MPPIDIEQPASFYLGREYDLASKTVLDKPLLYDARDLTTHGVVVGMTGSGKTGLCISLLEEAAIDGIPCILIDPKGDLANLLLQFPDLKPEDFQQWLDPEDARRKGVTLEEHGRQLAETWKNGLAEWGQTPERIARLRDSSEWRIYTPGSEAGLPLSILRTFAAPKTKLPREELNQKIDATSTALLGLTGLAADPVQSREHILIAQLLLHAWSKGQSLDLPQLIAQIQMPPVRTIGAFDVDTFYPEKDRLKLAVALNNILAAPSFSTWITGEALDLEKMLKGPKPPAPGKTRQIIFYLAHLEDAQRLFFLTLLLEEILSWTRKQAGTTSLRAIIYFDEVFGYLPPHPANPPTKLPLLTLLKQARAFGVGILLATQNPVDIDYKALSNAGSWFVGKLQTERDKARLVEGLEGVAAERGTLTDRSYLDAVISALDTRVFLLHDVHRSQPVLFKSRWALSFLRGPMTRDQIAQLMRPQKEETISGEPGASGEPGVSATGGNEDGPPPVAILLCPKCRAEVPPGEAVCLKCGTPWAPQAQDQDQEFKAHLLRLATPPRSPAAVSGSRPVLPSDVPQFYLKVIGPAPAGGQLLYQARLFGAALVVFADRRKGIEQRRTYRLLAEAGPAVGWAVAETIGDVLAEGPAAEARWADVPEPLTAWKKLAASRKTFLDHLYGNARTSVLVNRALELAGEPGEDVTAFRTRCRLAAGQAAARAMDAEREKMRPRFDALGMPLPDEQPNKESSWLDWVWGGLKPGPQAGTGSKEEKARRKLEADYRAKQAAVADKYRKIAEDYSEVRLQPRKTDIQVTHFGLAWAPFWQVETGGTVQVLAAYR